MPPVAQFQAVAKSFGGRPVLHGLDLEVREGEFLTLLGPSGCGKTTLLRLLAGFEIPDAGAILIDGQPVNALPPDRRDVNTVFQSYALFPHLSVFDNVAFGLRMKNTPRQEIQRRVEDALAAVRLPEYGERKPRQLSGGQQQRVALARALVNRPRVLLLDEPLSALDHKLRQAMQVELKALQRRLGIAFVFVTHDQEEALSLSDRVVVMRDGGIEQIGPPREIYAKPANRFVAEFVGAGNLLDSVVTSRIDPHSAFAVVEGTACVLRCPAALQAGQAFSLLLRPEDLRVVAASAPEARLQATVTETVYKGMTLDTLAELDGGKLLRATTLCGQAEAMACQPGQRVGISWAADSETVLADHAPA